MRLSAHLSLTTKINAPELTLSLLKQTPKNRPATPAGVMILAALMIHRFDPFALLPSIVLAHIS